MNIKSLLLECVERLQEGLESEGDMEPAWSKEDRELISRIRMELDKESK